MKVDTKNFFKEIGQHPDQFYIVHYSSQSLFDEGILRGKYGPAYASDPKMKNLVLLNGPLPPTFLDGGQEAAAFAAKDFIRMHASTICKVEFFRHVILLAQRGRLKTASKGWGVWVDWLLETRVAKVLVLVLGIIGGLVAAYQAFLWIKDMS